MDKYKMLRNIFVILGIILLLIGLFMGNYRDVFMKATKICYECIGIG